MPVAVVIAVVLVMLGGVGFGAWWLLLREGEGVTATGGYQAWQQAEEKLGAAEVKVKASQEGGEPNVKIQGQWFTDTHFVRKSLGKVVSYELKTGKVAWEYPLATKDSCPASAEQSGNRVALLTSDSDSRPNVPPKDCKNVTVLDISTGKKVWSGELPAVGTSKIYPGPDDMPVVFGDRVMVSTKRGGHVLDIETGKPDGKIDPRAECFSYRYAAFGDTLLAKKVCGSGAGSTGKGGALVAFDEKRKAQWTWELPESQGSRPPELLQVLSADPLVVEVNTGAGARSQEIWKVDPKTGKHTVVWKDEGSAEFVTPCDEEAPGLRNCSRGQVADGKLILTTAKEHINPGSDHEGEHGYPNYHNQAFALDLDTGEQVWQTALVQNRQLGLVTVDDGKVIAYQAALKGGASDDGVPGVVVAMDPATGKDSPLMALDQESTKGLRSLTQHYYFGGVSPVGAAWDKGRLALFLTTSQKSEGALETVVYK